MKFNKVISHKVKHLIPMALIAGATLLPASCRKYNPDRDTTPHHNTTYVWGKDNIKDVFPADNITKSLDSASVDFVILENDGVSWDGISTTIVWRYIEKILNDVKSDNFYKIRGAGTLNDVSISLSSKTHYQDSVNLATMGFKFGYIYHVK